METLQRQTAPEIQGDIMLADERMVTSFSANGNVLTADGDGIGSIGQVYGDSNEDTSESRANAGPWPGLPA